MTRSGNRWTDFSGKPFRYRCVPGQRKFLAAVVLLLLCMMPFPVYAAAPEVAIIDGPEEGAEIQQ
ncbi:MAG: hypothetical protein U9P10_01285 [Thermodesulfobacteriota bacterium]|nr:hypothetical protein [Thermodesulfobacteriota bacterium]